MIWKMWITGLGKLAGHGLDEDYNEFSIPPQNLALPGDQKNIRESLNGKGRKL